jgi:hypothetical protein
MAEDTWVCCDGCGKWRRIPQTVAADLDENSPWQVMHISALFTHYFYLQIAQFSPIYFSFVFSPERRHCKDSPDPIYNSCDVPQELTDTEIDERTKLPVSLYISVIIVQYHVYDVYHSKQARF